MQTIVKKLQAKEKENIEMTKQIKEKQEIIQ